MCSSMIAHWLSALRLSRKSWIRVFSDRSHARQYNPTPPARSRAAVSLKTRATIEDLYKVEGKAELVTGEIVHMPPAGEDPGMAGGQIFVSLHQYASNTKRGRALPDGVGFRVNLPHRESFSPDVAYHIGPRAGMRF